LINYTYNATVERWVDGDTVDLRVDLGFTVWIRQRFRLDGIDTPERGQPLWKEATERAKALLPEGSAILVKSFKTDKYGRYLGVLTSEALDKSVNDILVEEGFAKVYHGGKRT